MKKIVSQGLFIVVVFFSTWYFLKQIDWMHLFKIEVLTEKTEQKLGELFWEIFKESSGESTDPEVLNPIDSIISQICDKNGINRGKIKFHILEKEEINAFALPDHRLVLYSGLLAEVENQEALAGVIAHEIAHIELNHVMEKLTKELGLSFLISMTTGNMGSEIIAEAAKLLSSTAFDRKMEKEADLKAVDYLITSGIDPAHFSDFLESLATNESRASRYLTWINTHPHAKDRAAYIRVYARDLLVNE